MRKDPTLACLLNLLLVGIGHIYLGRMGKGLVILAMGIVLGMFVWVAIFPLIIWAMFDAYSTARRMNLSPGKAVADKSEMRKEG